MRLKILGFKVLALALPAGLALLAAPGAMAAQAAMAGGAPAEARSAEPDNRAERTIEEEMKASESIYRAALKRAADNTDQARRQAEETREITEKMESLEDDLRKKAEASRAVRQEEIALLRENPVAARAVERAVDAEFEKAESRHVKKQLIVSVSGAVMVTAGLAGSLLGEPGIIHEASRYSTGLGFGFAAASCYLSFVRRSK